MDWTIVIGGAGFFLAVVGLGFNLYTFHKLNLQEEVIVYPYQEKHGEYGIAIENIGKATAVNYTFKILSFDRDTKKEKKLFLNKHKLLNLKAKITISTGKVHKIRIGDQRDLKLVQTKRNPSLRRITKGEFPTIEMEVLKYFGSKPTILRRVTCDLKAFEDYPFTYDPIRTLQEQLSMDNTLSRIITRELIAVLKKKE